MKKKKFKQKLKAAFWLFFIAGCLWVAFAPHSVTPPHSVTVKVEQPPLVETPRPFQGGEEQMVQPPGEVVVPVPPEENLPIKPGHLLKIAIVIDDMGPDIKEGERAILLPAPVTLSFLPYAVHAREQAKEAHERGHEIILHMPMEPVGHENPGPDALLTDLPMPELQKRLDNALAAFPEIDGMNNHMGSKFTAWPEGMNLVVDDLLQRHIFFLDSRTSAQTIALKVARQKGLPSLSRDVFLDDDPSPEIIRKQLDAAETVARRKGYAVAICHPHAATIDVLEEWTAEASKRGIELVPLKDLVEKK